MRSPVRIRVAAPDTPEGIPSGLWFFIGLYAPATARSQPKHGGVGRCYPVPRPRFVRIYRTQASPTTQGERIHPNHRTHPRRTKPVRNIRHRRISGFRREGSIPDGANCDGHQRVRGALGALVFYKALCTCDGSVTTQARGCREMLPCAATAFCPHIPHPSIAQHPRRKNTPEPPYPPRRTKPVRYIRHRRISGFGFRALDAREIQLLHAPMIIQPPSGREVAFA